MPNYSFYTENESLQFIFSLSFLIENLTLECIKTALFLIPEIPKVPTVGSPLPTHPPPPLGR